MEEPIERKNLVREETTLRAAGPESFLYCPRLWRSSTGFLNRNSFFFFLQCRTSARHGRSTTGNCKDCFRKSPWKQNPKQKQHPHNQTNTNTTQKTNTHTKARRQPGNMTREICKLGETRWNKSPSQPLKCSLPPCSSSPCCPCLDVLHVNICTWVLRWVSNVWQSSTLELVRTLSSLPPLCAILNSPWMHQLLTVQLLPCQIVPSTTSRCHRWTVHCEFCSVPSNLYMSSTMFGPLWVQPHDTSFHHKGLCGCVWQPCQRAAHPSLLWISQWVLWRTSGPLAPPTLNWPPSTSAGPAAFAVLCWILVLRFPP